MRRVIAAILALAALTGVSAVFCASALADGDPASDVLIYDPVFNPPDSGASAQQAAQLNALVSYVSDHGYPLRVALINSAADLGTVTQLWKDPSDYSIYLGTELSSDFRGTLLVAMPDGYGLRTSTVNPTVGDERWGRAVTPPGSGLVRATYDQVVRLAADNGITVPSRLHVQSSVASGGSVGTGPLIGLLAGLAAVAVAWAVSLRVRPLRRRVVAA